jgi:uncharacterized metal-binding protein YceD (DUF177 family)
MKTPDIAYSHPVAVSTLHGSSRLTLEPDAAARTRIAKSLGLHAVNALVARLEMNGAENGLVTVEGTLEADVEPVCVVTLDPFAQHVAGPVAIRFAPAGLIEKMTKRAQADGIEDFEPPDEISAGTIDFGALAVEFLALALDPYPRKPGAEFGGLNEDKGGTSPFEALKQLKRS